MADVVTSRLYFCHLISIAKDALAGGAVALLYNYELLKYYDVV
jgi:hypothetical protein